MFILQSDNLLIKQRSNYYSRCAFIRRKKVLYIMSILMIVILLILAIFIPVIMAFGENSSIHRKSKGYSLMRKQNEKSLFVILESSLLHPIITILSVRNTSMSSMIVIGITRFKTCKFDIIILLLMRVFSCMYCKINKI